MDKIKVSLDGPIEQQTRDLKIMLGLRPDQSFQDLDAEPFTEEELKEFEPEDDKTVNVIDGGTLEERVAEMKEFFGLRPDQSFQDLKVDVEDENV